MTAVESALDAFVSRIVRRELSAVGGRAGEYSQHDGERPVGVSRDRYLRIWSAARKAGDPGAIERGRARVLSASAFERFEGALRVRRRAAAEPAPAPKAPDVLARLGARRVA